MNRLLNSHKLQAAKLRTNKPFSLLIPPIHSLEPGAPVAQSFLCWAGVAVPA